MLTKSFTAGVIGSALLASVAFAQNTPSPSTTSSDAKSTETLSPQSVQGDWRASKVVGLSVYNDNKDKVGSINDLLMDKSGNIKAVVLGVGGFLGMGEHLVAVPFDKVKFSNEPVSTGTASNMGNTAPAGNRPAGSTTGAAPTTSSGTATTTNTSSGSSTSSKWYPDHAVFNASKDELKNMPEFKYSE